MYSISFFSPFIAPMKTWLVYESLETGLKTYYTIIKRNKNTYMYNVYMFFLLYQADFIFIK